MSDGRDRVTIRIWQLFEGSAEGRWAISAFLVAFFGFLIGRAMGWF